MQSPSHLRSLALYSKLGFDVREPLVLVGGAPIAASTKDNEPDRLVRLAGSGDLAECNQLCASIHGFERQFELSEAIHQQVTTVVERRGKIVGYAAGVGFMGHSVSETTEDLKALISSATSFQGPGFFVPVRNGELQVALGCWSEDDMAGKPDDVGKVLGAYGSVHAFDRFLTDEQKTPTSPPAWPIDGYLVRTKRGYGIP